MFNNQKIENAENVMSKSSIDAIPEMKATNTTIQKRVVGWGCCNYYYVDQYVVEVSDNTQQSVTGLSWIHLTKHTFRKYLKDNV